MKNRRVTVKCEHRIRKATGKCEHRIKKVTAMLNTEEGREQVSMNIE